MSLANLEQLPDELQLQILSRLNYRDLSNICQTSTRFSQICKDEELWHTLTRRNYFYNIKYKNTWYDTFMLHKYVDSLIDRLDARGEIGIPISRHERIIIHRPDGFFESYMITYQRIFPAVKKVPDIISLARFLIIMYVKDKAMVPSDAQLADYLKHPQLTFSGEIKILHMFIEIINTINKWNRIEILASREQNPTHFWPLLKMYAYAYFHDTLRRYILSALLKQMP